MVGHFKIDGHSDIKHQKAFLGPKQLQDKKARVKGSVSSNRRWQPISKKARLNNKILLFLCTVVLFSGFSLLIFGMKDSLPAEQARVQRNEITTQRRLAREKQEAIDFLMASGNNLLQSNAPDAALEEYRRVLKLNPNHVEATQRIQEIMAN